MQVKSKSGRVFDLPDQEETKRIQRGIAADPDTCTLEEFKNMRPVARPKAEATKERVTIRLSPEVTAYFRATGKGWKTRLDEALKEYVDARR
jgi:uncharacterized protein (DUF4415 family)